MTLLEQLKITAGMVQSSPHVAEMCAKAATEIESLQKDLDGLRRQNAELKLEVEECRALLRVASVTAGNLEEQTASLLKDFAVSEKQNAELREALQMVKDEDLRCWQEVAEVGHTEFNYSARMVNAVNKALAAQPEVKP